MIITKNLTVESMDHFFRLIHGQESLLESSNKLLCFYDFMLDYYYGCECIEEVALSEATNAYQEITNDEEVHKILKSYFSIQEVTFLL